MRKYKLGMVMRFAQVHTVNGGKLKLEPRFPDYYAVLCLKQKNSRRNNEKITINFPNSHVRMPSGNT